MEGGTGEEEENLLKSARGCPDQCGSVGWALPHKPKDRWFNSQSGHTPGLWARSLVGGVWEETDQCFSHTFTLMFLSLSFSFPSLLSKTN